MKKFIAIICMLVLCLSLCACGKTEPEESKPGESISESIPESEPEESKTEKKTLALCMSAIEHPLHRLAQYGFIKTAEELGYNAKICGLKSAPIQELLAEWGTLLNDRDIQGVAIWTGDDSCYDLLKEFSAKEIHTVVPYYVHGYEYSHEFIEYNPATDEFGIGTDAARFVIEALKERGITEGTIGMSQIGAGGTDNARNDKFREIIANTDFTMLNGIIEGPEITESTSKATKYINDNPDMVAAVSLTGNLKTWTTAKANTGRDDLIVLNYAYGQPIEDFTTDGFMIDPFYEAGVEAAKALAALNEGKTYTEAEWQSYLPVNTVDREGYAEYEARYNEAQEYFAK